MYLIFFKVLHIFYVNKLWDATDFGKRRLWIWKINPSNAKSTLYWTNPGWTLMKSHSQFSPSMEVPDTTLNSRIWSWKNKVRSELLFASSRLILFEFQTSPNFENMYYREHLLWKLLYILTPIEIHFFYLKYVLTL